MASISELTVVFTVTTSSSFTHILLVNTLVASTYENWNIISVSVSLTIVIPVDCVYVFQVKIGLILKYIFNSPSALLTYGT